MADDTDSLAVVIFENASNPIPKGIVLALDMVAPGECFDRG